jgi:hypothetical protein
MRRNERTIGITPMKIFPITPRRFIVSHNSVFTIFSA